jgi:hypothetical protein
MKTCATCKHWNRYTDKYDVEIFTTHAGVCNHDKFVYNGFDPHGRVETPKDGLMHWDGDGWKAYFNTGEDFGCVHWTGGA